MFLIKHAARCVFPRKLVGWTENFSSIKWLICFFINHSNILAKLDRLQEAETLPPLLFKIEFFATIMKSRCIVLFLFEVSFWQPSSHLLNLHQICFIYSCWFYSFATSVIMQDSMPLLSASLITQLFTCSRSTRETLEQVWNMFKANNKSTRTTSLIFHIFF